MQSPLPEYPAYYHARHLQQLLLEEGVVDFDGEGKVSTKRFFEPGGGIMFGVLVARDEGGNEVLLKAYSGLLGGIRNLPGWAGHVVSKEAWQDFTECYDSVIKSEPDRHMQRRLSQTALGQYYRLYRLPTLAGSTVGLEDCFTDGDIPTGSGDCCAIKLLTQALKEHLHPLSMAEFFFGDAKGREHLAFYPPCDEKCRPILEQMLGLDIVYRDEQLVIVNKPSGLLSVPGNGEEKMDSVETRLRRLFPQAPRQCAVHRLDMDSSGLLVLALTKQAHSVMNKLFREQQVEKRYVALLDGVLKQESGIIELPFRADITNRPYQVYDEVNGKWGLTKFTRLRVEKRPDGKLATRVLFEPQTGRTHQLRLHSSHHRGLGIPILGDRLYGSGLVDRLYLHAGWIKFPHPITKSMLTVEIEAPF